jgi:hypothetical protein
MKKHLIVLGIVLAFFTFVTYQNARAEDSVKDAKVAFENLANAAKAKNTGEAKKYITKEFIKVLGKDFDRWLADVAKVEPKAVKAVVRDKSVRLTFERVEPGMTFYFMADMVKDAGQWKVGGPL